MLVSTENASKLIMFVDQRLCANYSLCQHLRMLFQILTAINFSATQELSGRLFDSYVICRLNFGPYIGDLSDRLGLGVN